ncbi:MAG: arylamine N-acetyltransferase [Rhizobacter sp.]|nr:arylamine N-acetyltransferase [Rhizobacter sp.]
MIDLDLYCRRIGYRGPREASLATLAALCAGQPAHIVYENIDPLLGTAPTLEFTQLQHKLLHRGRGGYCYEQNLLLWQALVAFGFEVTALAARVVWNRPPDAPLRPRSHMLLRVTVDGAEYLADAGFGGQMLDVPLRVEPGTPQATPHGLLRVSVDGEVHTVESKQPTGWAPMYRFTLEPHAAADYEPLNWYTATHHGSIFRHNLVMERVTPALRTSLLNDRLVLRQPGLPPAVHRITTLEALGEVLAERFSLRLADDTVRALFERVPKGLDQMVVPAAS